MQDLTTPYGEKSANEWPLNGYWDWFLLQDRQQLLHVAVGAGNHVGGDDFAQAGRGSAAGLDGGLHSADIAYTSE